MPVYEMRSDAIRPLQEVTFSHLGLHERGDIQRLLRECIDVISPDTLVISEEFSSWSEGNRRIDLLGVHKSGDLVVIELKRDDASHMELQALRYAAMVSTMTLAQAIETYQTYLSSRGMPDDGAAQKIADFLEIDAKFGESVRIVLAASTFHKEITSTVLWLNDRGLNISCARLTPYSNDGKVFLDVDRFIPLPGAEEYQIAIRNKVAVERIAESERVARNLAKYSLHTSFEDFDSLSKRDLIFNVVKIALELNVGVQQIQEAVPWKPDLFVSAKGSLAIDEFLRQEGPRAKASGLNLERRYFKDQKRLLAHDGMTYLMRRDWGPKTERAVQNVIKLLPEGHGVTYSVQEGDESA
ncbi:oxidoreductase [Paraburkholderia caballeronis]|uniref:oxidoreductase n=1 Tax=Paraburkholderia caballeronis TaxID=416943 RepID=UPI001066144D|nr:oxidoreductase [Paraburkholderia caballeronis]TDV07816.1 hypothetical protein C7408_11935 [Paraburkholderia caballeronis]TDV11179.1 hypothetical protein C7406_12235 [Paraburkholderia caballeronis]TDV21559.1 hypothetical protein C7404_12223 [Paraburkholderia caballeronis]